MNSQINSLVADSVRQGCRQLDGYLQDLITSAKSSFHDSLDQWSRDLLQIADAKILAELPINTQKFAESLSSRYLACLDDFTNRARIISFQILDEFEERARKLGTLEIEPLINTQIEAVILKELQKAQQILIEEREETSRLHDSIRKALRLTIGRSSLTVTSTASSFESQLIADDCTSSGSSRT